MVLLVAISGQESVNAWSSLSLLHSHVHPSQGPFLDLAFRRMLYRFSCSNIRHLDSSNNFVVLDQGKESQQYIEASRSMMLES